MNPGKSTTKSGKTSKGFTDEEKAAMKERAEELKAEARADKDKAEGESAVLAKIAAMPNRIASWPSGSMRSSRPARQTCRRKPGTGCPRMPTRMAMSSASSKLRTSSRRDTRRSASTTTANLDEGAMWPTAFALTKLTAAEEAKIGALVKKAVS